MGDRELPKRVIGLGRNPQVIWVRGHGRGWGRGGFGFRLDEAASRWEDESG
jgi:hypothetical protein